MENSKFLKSVLPGQMEMLKGALNHMLHEVNIPAEIKAVMWDYMSHKVNEAGHNLYAAASAELQQAADKKAA